MKIMSGLAVGRTRGGRFKMERARFWWNTKRENWALRTVQLGSNLRWLFTHEVRVTLSSCSADVYQQQGVFPVLWSNPLSPQLFDAVQLSCCCLSSWQLRQQQYNISEPLSTSARRLAIGYCEGRGLAGCRWQRGDCGETFWGEESDG